MGEIAKFPDLENPREGHESLFPSHDSIHSKYYRLVHDIYSNLAYNSSGTADPQPATAEFEDTEITITPTITQGGITPTTIFYGVKISDTKGTPMMFEVVNANNKDDGSSLYRIFTSDPDATPSNVIPINRKSPTITDLAVRMVADSKERVFYDETLRKFLAFDNKVTPIK